MNEGDEILNRLIYLICVADCVIDRKVGCPIKNCEWGLQSFRFNGLETMVDFEIELYSCREDLFNYVLKKDGRDG
jgi:hypothetical protein